MPDRLYLEHRLRRAQHGKVSTTGQLKEDWETEEKRVRAQLDALKDQP